MADLAETMGNFFAAVSYNASGDWCSFPETEEDYEETEMEEPATYSDYAKFGDYTVESFCPPNCGGPSGRDKPNPGRHNGNRRTIS